MILKFVPNQLRRLFFLAVVLFVPISCANSLDPTDADAEQDTSRPRQDLGQTDEDTAPDGDGTDTGQDSDNDDLAPDTDNDTDTEVNDDTDGSDSDSPCDRLTLCDAGDPDEFCSGNTRVTCETNDDGCRVETRLDCAESNAVCMSNSGSASCVNADGGNTCGDAIAVGPGVYIFSTTGKGNNYTLFLDDCAPTIASSGADMVLSIGVPAGQTLSVLADPGDSGHDAIAVITSACASIETSCVDFSYNAGIESVTATNGSGSAQTYYIVLDGRGAGDHGEVTVDIEVQ